MLVSGYNADSSASFTSYLTPCLIHQPLFNLFSRGASSNLFCYLRRRVLAVFHISLAQGLRTDRYLNGLLFDSSGKSACYLRKMP